MIKQHEILTQCARWISAIAGIVSRPSAIVENQLSTTSTMSSSTLASFEPLKFYPHHPCILIKGKHFGLNPIGGSSIHHQFIAPTSTLVMSHRPTNVAEQLLWSLHILQ